MGAGSPMKATRRRCGGSTRGAGKCCPWRQSAAPAAASAPKIWTWRPAKPWTSSPVFRWIYRRWSASMRAYTSSSRSARRFSGWATGRWIANFAVSSRQTALRGIGTPTSCARSWKRRNAGTNLAGRFQFFRHLSRAGKRILHGNNAPACNIFLGDGKGAQELPFRLPLAGCSVSRGPVAG